MLNHGGVIYEWRQGTWRHRAGLFFESRTGMIQALDPQFFDTVPDGVPIHYNGDVIVRYGQVWSPLYQPTVRETDYYPPTEEWESRHRPSMTRQRQEAPPLNTHLRTHEVREVNDND